MQSSDNPGFREAMRRPIFRSSVPGIVAGGVKTGIAPQVFVVGTMIWSPARCSRS